MNKKICVIILFLVVLTSCKVNEIEYEDITIPESQEMISVNNKTDDLNINIEYQKPEILYNKTSLEGVEDDQLCTISYMLKITNLDSEPIEIFAKFFITEKMYDVFIASRDCFGTQGGKVKLEPQQAIYISAHLLILHTDRYTEEEFSIFNSEKAKLESIIMINDQEYYIFLDDTDTVESIYDES